MISFTLKHPIPADGGDISTLKARTVMTGGDMVHLATSIRVLSEMGEKVRDGNALATIDADAARAMIAVVSRMTGTEPAIIEQMAFEEIAELTSAIMAPAGESSGSGGAAPNGAV